MIRALILGLLLLAAPPALAVNPNEMLKDPALEARARELGKELRCVVCQNQSIDDSDAELARDLRVLVRKRLSLGDSDQAVKEYVVARYGDYVLLKPPVKGTTLVLWGGPFVLFAVGLLVVRTYYRRRAKTLPPPPLSDDEKRRLDALLADKGEP